jgi:hypothetical protein
MTARKVRPILFRRYLTESILANRKTKTRRLILADSCTVTPGNFAGVDFSTGRGGRMNGELRAQCKFESGRIRVVSIHSIVKAGDWYWVKDGRFGSRKASNLTLEITQVLAKRLQDMTDQDAIDEGVEFIPLRMRKTGTPRDWFGRLWDDIYGNVPAASWTDNPWVWELAFDPKTANVDQLLQWEAGTGVNA